MGGERGGERNLLERPPTKKCFASWSIPTRAQNPAGKHPWFKLPTSDCRLNLTVRRSRIVNEVDECDAGVWLSGGLPGSDQARTTSAPAALARASRQAWGVSYQMSFWGYSPISEDHVAQVLVGFDSQAAVGSHQRGLLGQMPVRVLRVGLQVANRYQLGVGAVNFHGPFSFGVRCANGGLMPDLLPTRCKIFLLNGLGVQSWGSERASGSFN